MDNFNFYKTVPVTASYYINGCFEEADYIVPLYFEDKSCITVERVYKAIVEILKNKYPGVKDITIHIHVMNYDINF